MRRTIHCKHCGQERMQSDTAGLCQECEPKVVHQGSRPKARPYEPVHHVARPGRKVSPTRIVVSVALFTVAAASFIGFIAMGRIMGVF